MSDEHSTKEQADRPFLTATEVADWIGVSDKTIRKRIANGEIKARKQGRVWQVPISEVERIAEESADSWETPTEPTDRHETASMSGTNGNSADRCQTEASHIRNELDKAIDRAISSDKRLQTALDSIQGLTEQIDHLTQLLAMKEKNVAALTEQLNASRSMIEDLRHRKPLWKRIFQRGK